MDENFMIEKLRCWLNFKKIANYFEVKNVFNFESNVQSLDTIG